MKFKYKATKKDGVVYENTIEVTDKEELFKQLRDKEESIISAYPVSENRFSVLDYLNSMFNGIKITEQVFFARNLGSMVDAGLSISRATSVMVRQAKNEKFKKILIQLRESIENGKSLSSALGEFPNIFSPLFVHMTQAGEESGSLTKSLNVIADQMENSDSLRKKVKGALTYPAVVFAVMFIIGILMLIYVVPSLVATFKEFKMDLPFSTRFLIFVSDFLSSHYLIFAVGLFGIITSAMVFLKTETGKIFSSYIVLHLPVISNMAKETNSAWTSRTLASLLFSGVDVVRSLEITKGVVSNVYYKEVMEKAEKSIQKGTPLSSLFEERPDLYPPFVAEMVKVGEETGKLPDMLLKLADFYEKEVDQKTKNISTIVEPILMVIVGLLVGFFAFAIISPMYSLMGGI